jgi:hypothetical protein
VIGKSSTPRVTPCPNRLPLSKLGLKGGMLRIRAQGGEGGRRRWRARRQSTAAERAVQCGSRGTAMSLDGGCAAVAAGPKSMEAEKEGGGSGLLNGRARRPSGRCDTTAGTPLHCWPVAMQVVAVGPQIHGGGEGGWRQWVAQWWSMAAERVVRQGGRHAAASPAGGCASGGGGAPNRVWVPVFQVVVAASFDDIATYRSLGAGGGR